MPVNKVIFLDDPKDADGYLAGLSDDDKRGLNEVLFIAMNPVTHAHLLKSGVSVHNTHGYFTNGSHEQCLKSSDRFMTWLRANAIFSDSGMEIRYAFKNSFIFHARLIIHYCLWATEIILNVIDEHAPKTVSAFMTDRRMVTSFAVRPEERYLGHVTKLCALSRGIRFEDAAIVTRTRKSSGLSLIKIYAVALFKHFLKTARFQLWKTFVSAKRVRDKKEIVLFTTRKYRMDELASAFLRKNPAVSGAFLDGPVIFPLCMPEFLVRLCYREAAKNIVQQKKLLNELAGRIAGEKAELIFRGVSLSEALARKMRDNINDYVTGLMGWSVVLDRFLTDVRPKAVITNGNRAEDVVLAELCRSDNIPNILISHGSHVYPKNEFESIEGGELGTVFLRAPFSVIALQTPLTEQYLSKFPSDNIVVRTGPLIWGTDIDKKESAAVFRRICNGRYEFGKTKIVVHAGTPKISSGLRLHIYETPDEYIQALRDLSLAIETIPDTVLVIRFRPSPEISEESIRALVPFSGKVMLSVAERFVDILGMADLLVSYASTTIEEALQNGIPVLLYGGGGRYQHISASEVAGSGPVRISALYHIKDRAVLESGIRNILKTHGESADNRHLFEPYVYPKEKRFSLEEIITMKDVSDGNISSGVPVS